MKSYSLFQEYTRALDVGSSLFLIDLSGKTGIFSIEDGEKKSPIYMPNAQCHNSVMDFFKQSLPNEEILLMVRRYDPKIIVFSE